MALSGGSSGLILERINESKGVGRHPSPVLRRQKPKAPNRDVNCVEAGRTGTQNPPLPFRDPEPPIPSFPSHNKALRLVEMDPHLHTAPDACRIWILPPTRLDPTKYPETRPLPPPFPHGPSVVAQVGARGEAFLAGMGFQWFCWATWQS